MIVGLRGVLLSLDGGHATVDVDGVFYQVTVGARIASRVGDVGGDVVLYTHYRVTADSVALYGFATGDERDLFGLLLRVGGVGPGTAMALLDAFGPETLRQIIAAGDTGALSTVNGVGPRTAAKIVFELAPKLEATVSAVHSNRTVAREALAGLGYTTDEIASALADVGDSVDTAEQVAAALRTLGRTPA